MKCKVVVVSALTVATVLTALEWFSAAHPVATWFALLVMWVSMLFAPLAALICDADRRLKEYEQ